MSFDALNVVTGNQWHHHSAETGDCTDPFAVITSNCKDTCCLESCRQLPSIRQNEVPTAIVMLP